MDLSGLGMLTFRVNSMRSVLENDLTSWSAQEASIIVSIQLAFLPIAEEQANLRVIDLMDKHVEGRMLFFQQCFLLSSTFLLSRRKFK